VDFKQRRCHDDPGPPLVCGTRQAPCALPGRRGGPATRSEAANDEADKKMLAPNRLGDGHGRGKFSTIASQLQKASEISSGVTLFRALPN